MYQRRKLENDDFIQSFPISTTPILSRAVRTFQVDRSKTLYCKSCLKAKNLFLMTRQVAVDTATDARIRKAFSEEIPDTTKIIISQRISSVENADKSRYGRRRNKCSGNTRELVNSSPIYSEIFRTNRRKRRL